MKRLHTLVPALSALVLLGACSSVGVGISLPIPGIGSIGVGGTSDGRVSGGVSVGSGNVRVGVGASGRLPAADAAASAASAPTR
jgi:hypothetical protein